MSLAAAKTRIASFASRLVAEYARAGLVAGMNKGGAQTEIMDILTREFASVPATENLPALLKRLCDIDADLELVKSDEQTARESVIRAIIGQTVDFETLLAGFKPGAKWYGAPTKGALSHSMHPSARRAERIRAEKLAQCIERARANG